VFQAFIGHSAQHLGTFLQEDVAFSLLVSTFIKRIIPWNSCPW